MSQGKTSDGRTTRTIEWTPIAEMHARARELGCRTGLELLTAMKDGRLPRPPIAELMDFYPTEVSVGRTVFECRPEEYHYNPTGVVHGGLAATLCDTAMACAILTELPLNVGNTTLELKVNFIRPMTEATGQVRCIGEALHVGKRTATAESRLVDGEDRLLAHGSTTCLVLSGESS